MVEVEEPYEKGGFLVNLFYDEHPTDPREGATSQMGCAHRRYDLGDVDLTPHRDWIDPFAYAGWHILSGLTEGDSKVCLEIEEAWGPNYWPLEHSGNEELADRAWEEVHERAVILPLKLHDHSGISMSVGTGGGWDSGQVGWIWKEKETKGSSEDEVEDGLRREVEIYSQYLEGRVYGFQLTRPESSDYVFEGTRTGFYDLDRCKEEAHSTANRLIL